MRVIKVLIIIVLSFFFFFKYLLPVDKYLLSKRNRAVGGT